MAKEKNVSRELVNTIVESMKGRDNVWQQTWENMAEVGTPNNPITGTQYKGINFISLAIEQTKLKTQDSRWCTFDQAVEAGFKIPKDTKAAHAYFYDLNVTLKDGEKPHYINAKNTNDHISKIIAYYREQYPAKAKDIKDALHKANELKPSISSDKGKIALFVGELNKATGAKIELSCFPYMKSFPIFNYSQLENVPELEIKPVNKENVYNRVEGILIASGAKIKHSDENFYNPQKHEINLKAKESLTSPEKYYSTAVHQLAQWASVDEIPFKPDSKTNDDESNQITHAREELKAELANIFISAELGLDLNVQDRSSHNGSYIELLDNDYKELFSAVTHANRIATHVLNFEKRLDLESEVAKELQSENPKLYKKIETFKALELSIDRDHEASADIASKSNVKSKEVHMESDKEHLETKVLAKDNEKGVKQKSHANKDYLEKFFEEKDLPLKEFTIKHNGEDNFISNEVVIDFIINSADSKTQGKIKDTLIKLDYANADVNHFLEHFAKGIVMQHNANHDMDALSNIDSKEFKHNELAHELRNESKFQNDVSTIKEVKEKAPLVASNSIDNDNDFSI